MSKKKSSDLFFGHGGAYDPARDGSLDQYLETHDGNTTMPWFRGYEHFELLRKEGWLGPRMSIIRLMWNVGRGDEHFWVTDEYKLQGIPHDQHGGRAGIHEPKKVLEEGPCFEASSLLYPYMREEWAKALQEIRELEKQKKPDSSQATSNEPIPS